MGLADITFQVEKNTSSDSLRRSSSITERAKTTRLSRIKDATRADPGSGRCGPGGKSSAMGGSSAAGAGRLGIYCFSPHLVQGARKALRDGLETGDQVLRGSGEYPEIEAGEYRNSIVYPQKNSVGTAVSAHPTCRFYFILAGIKWRSGELAFCSKAWGGLGARSIKRGA